jgi:hypothetical protein
VPFGLAVHIKIFEPYIYSKISNKGHLGKFSKSNNKEPY